jgi:hypothetical protein
MDSQTLLGYFAASGALSVEQLRFLHERGYLQNFHEPDESWSNYHDDYDDHDPYGDETEDHETPAPARRKKGKGRTGANRPGKLSATQLNARLAAAVEEAGDHLAGLRQVARLLGPANSLKRAAISVSQASAETLSEQLSVALGQQAISFGDVWNFLSFAGHRAILAGPAVKGPALTAFRAVLATGEQVVSPRYAWILRRRTVRLVCQMVQAQRRLLAAFGSFYRRAPAELAAALRRQPQRLGLWTLVLLYNSGLRCAGPGEAPYPAEAWGGRHERVYRLADEDMLQAAWACALQMDAERVAPFFQTFHTPAATPVEPGENAGVELWCPQGWNDLLLRC